MNPSSEDPYKILGLSPDATEKQIKTGYRRLAKKFHPDKNPDNPEAERKFKQIQWAYEKLRKHKRPKAIRQGYDPQSSPFTDSADPFLNFFTAVRSHYPKKTKGK